MNLYQIYQDAVNNNDGMPVESLSINNKEYAIRTAIFTNNYFEILLKIDDDRYNDISIAIYDYNGDVVWSNLDTVLYIY